MFYQSICFVFFEDSKCNLLFTQTPPQRKWEMESQTAELAFASEVTKMRVVHEEKTLADNVYFKNKREEMESFKDAEKQEIPAAERLEEFARIEVRIFLRIYCSFTR